MIYFSTDVAYSRLYLILLFTKRNFEEVEKTKPSREAMIEGRLDGRNGA